MPSLPDSGFQLVVLLILILPGVVYQFVRTRLRGPVPDDASALTRVLRAIGVSVFLVSMYAVLVGPNLLRLVDDAQSAARVGQVENVRQLGLVALLLLFVVPAVLAYVDYLRRTKLTTDFLNLSYNPAYPTAWDFAFTDRPECFVRVLTEDGRWIGGLLSDKSWLSSFPEPREIFAEIAYTIDDTGTFGAPIPDSGGIFIRCDTVALVEFINLPTPP